MTRGVFVLLLSSACATARPEALPPSELDFSLPDTGGRIVSAQDLRGNVVLLDLWATWCKPCIRSFPLYAELHRKHQARGFEVVAVSVDESDELVIDFVRTHEIPFVVLRDPKGDLPERLGVRTMPTAFIADREGRITLVHPGFVEGDAAKIEAELERLLGVGEPR